MSRAFFGTVRISLIKTKVNQRPESYKACKFFVSHLEHSRPLLFFYLVKVKMGILCHTFGINKGNVPTAK